MTSVDISAIVQAVLQATLASNASSIEAKPTPTYLTTSLTHPKGNPYEKLFLKARNEDRHSFPIFQVHIRTWFEIYSFMGVTDFTRTLPGSKY